MKLCNGNVGCFYKIRFAAVDEVTAGRLEALGVNENTRILVLNKKRSQTMIIKVRGTRLALGGKITGGIEVEAEGVRYGHER